MVKLVKCWICRIALVLLSYCSRAASERNGTLTIIREIRCKDNTIFILVFLGK